MVLVFVFALIMLVLVVLTNLISTLRINIKKLELSNETPNTPLIKELEISIEIYILNKIKIYRKNITNQSLQNMNSSKRLEKLKNTILDNGIKNKDKKNNKIDVDILKLLKPKLQQINLELKIGTEDVVLTSFLICIISILISMLLSKTIEKYDEEKYKYKIIPNYNNQNSIKIIVSSIIDIKLVNIINILLKLGFRRGVNDKRTSNRGFNDNRNEQYPRDDRCKYNYRGTN